MLANKFFRSVCIVFMMLTFAQASAQSVFREEFAPKAGKGPGVLLISGQTGPDPRRGFAKDLAAEGYYVLLVDGNDHLSAQKNGPQNFRDSVAQLLASPNVTSNKVAVVGFSLGGGGVLAYAISASDTVSGAVAIYPATFWLKNIDVLASRISVPLTMTAAGKDSYQNCCLIERAREIEAAAKAKGKPFELTVYPDADHGYDLTGRNYRRDYTLDTWKRTIDALKAAHANTAK